MVRISQTPRLSPSRTPGFLDLKCPYSKQLIALLRKYPKSHWDKGARTWQVPVELGQWLVPYMRNELKWQVSADLPALEDGPELSGFFPYQLESAQRAARDGFHFLNYSMGCGKTAAAIVALRAHMPRRTLIVCPAVVKRVWETQLARWWPHHPDVHTIKTGAQAEEHSADGITVVSYHLVHKLKYSKWGAIVLDESHMAKNPRSAMGAACAHLGAAHQGALKLALSGTPVAQEPQDLYNQMEFLRPGGFGSIWEFRRRYVDREENPWAASGYVWKGVRNEDELRARLDYFSSRVTLEEVSDMLPPITVSALEVEDKRQAIPELLAGIPDHVIIFTFRRETARQVAHACGKRSVCVVTGHDTPADRHVKIDNALCIPGSVLVATMDSIGTGIDSLTKFRNAFFVEASPKLSTMRQALGRIRRLSSTGHVSATMLYQRGSRDEEMMLHLEQKLNDINKVVAPGEAEDALATFLGGAELSDEEWAAKVNDELTECEDADEYF